LTYYCAKFDIRYVIQRGGLYQLNFESVFSGLQHLDLYEVVRHGPIDFPSYGQKSVEKCLGIPRVVENLSGATYHRFFLDFPKRGNPQAILYDIEGSLGCLRILEVMKNFFKKKRHQITMTVEGGP
jgi:uncharacterized protein YprB with RNaseH-like and TPR domain